MTCPFWLRTMADSWTVSPNVRGITEDREIVIVVASGGFTGPPSPPVRRGITATVVDEAPDPGDPAQRGLPAYPNLPLADSSWKYSARSKPGSSAFLTKSLIHRPARC